jgi:hypothetical protein
LPEGLAITRLEVFDKGSGYGFMNEMDSCPAKSSAGHLRAEVPPRLEVEPSIGKEVEFRAGDLVIMPQRIVTRAHQRRQFLGLARLEGGAEIGDPLHFRHCVSGSSKETIPESVAVLFY